MLKIMNESEGPVVGIRASGLLHEEDYTTLLPELEARFDTYGKLRLLFFADSGFEGWDIRAAWDDMSFGLKHASDFERLALVGAPDWVVWCLKLSAFLMKGEVKVFDSDALDAAWDWVRA